MLDGEVHLYAIIPSHATVASLQSKEKEKPIISWGSNNAFQSSSIATHLQNCTKA